MCTTYNQPTKTIRKNKVDADIDGYDNVISVINPQERCLQTKVKIRFEPKQVIQKSHNLKLQVLIDMNNRNFQLFSIKQFHTLLSSQELNTEI